jgi:hypothetical protein
MKVSEAIRRLQTYQSPDDDIMIMWFSSSAKETKAHVWQKACELWDDDDKEIIFEYMRDVIVDAEIFYEKREMAELAIDSYLDQRAEHLAESVKQ